VATIDEHLDQFQHNDVASQVLARAGDNWDWAVTAMFYAALHLCQAYLIRAGLEANSHGSRDRQMLASPQLRPILDQYRALRNDSQEARYECRRFSLEEYESIREGSFTILTTHLRALLGVS
jgi:hypothetical protein